MTTKELVVRAINMLDEVQFRLTDKDKGLFLESIINYLEYLRGDLDE